MPVFFVTETASRQFVVLAPDEKAATQYNARRVLTETPWEVEHVGADRVSGLMPTYIAASDMGLPTDGFLAASVSATGEHRALEWPVYPSAKKATDAAKKLLDEAFRAASNSPENSK